MARRNMLSTVAQEYHVGLSTGDPNSVIVRNDSDAAQDNAVFPGQARLRSDDGMLD